MVNGVFLIYSTIIFVVAVLMDTYIVQYVNPIKRYYKTAVILYFLINLIQYMGEWALASFCSFEVYDRWVGRLIMGCLVALLSWCWYFLEGNNFFCMYGKLCLYYVVANMFNTLVCQVGVGIIPGAKNLVDISGWGDYGIVVLHIVASFVGVMVVHGLKGIGILEKLPNPFLGIVGLVITVLGGLSFFVKEYGTIQLYKGKKIYMMLMYVNIPTIIVFFLLLSYFIYVVKRANYLMEEEICQQYRYYSILSDLQMRMHALRHDLVNHKIILNSLQKIDEDKKENYESHLLQEIGELRVQRYVDAHAVNLLLCFCAAEFKRQGIAVEIQISDRDIKQEIKYFYVLSSVMEYVSDSYFRSTKSDEEKWGKGRKRLVVEFTTEGAEKVIYFRCQGGNNNKKNMRQWSFLKLFVMEKGGKLKRKRVDKEKIFIKVSMSTAKDKG